MTRSRLCTAVACLLLAAAMGSALSPVRAAPIMSSYERDILSLSEQLGALHHLRGTCTREEQMLWRESIKALIRHETPSRRQARAMTERFNEGYRTARTEHPRCTRESEAQAAVHANEAARLARVLKVQLEPEPDDTPR